MPFLYITVFITGMAVVAVELTASRLLAPYFGASLFIWTNIIGVVMVALALGYFIGGKIADKDEGRRAKKVLYPLIFATGILISLIPFLGKPVFLLGYQAITSGSLSVFLPSLIATLLLLSLPIMLLGMVSPIVARCALHSMDNAGKIIGSLYAFSTVGSIVGTFLPVLVTIPFLGTRETFYIFGASLIILGAVGMARRQFLVFLIIPVLLFLVPSTIHSEHRLLYENESPYNYIRVEEGTDKTRYLVTNEGLGMQSLYHPDRVLTGSYWDVPAVLPYMNPAAKNMLIVGSAGSSTARVMGEYFPELKLYGVEIDPLMQKVAEEFFPDSTRHVEVTISDGRVFLNRTQQKYDFIMIDVYKDELYIPFHLATQEFFATAKNALTPHGILIMNIAAGGKDPRLKDVIINTVTSGFDFVYQYQLPGTLNTMLFASDDDLGALLAHSEIAGPIELVPLVSQVTNGLQRVAHNPASMIATDNNSPLELFTEIMLMKEVLE